MVKAVDIPDEVIRTVRYKIATMSDAREFRRYVIVLLAADKRYTLKEISELLNIAPHTVSEAIDIVISTFGRVEKKRTGVRTTPYLSKEEEQDFLKVFEEQDREGKVIVVSEVHKVFIERIGRRVPVGNMYKLLSRNGWRRVRLDRHSADLSQGPVEEYIKRGCRFKWMKL